MVLGLCRESSALSRH